MSSHSYLLTSMARKPVSDGRLPRRRVIGANLAISNLTPTGCAVRLDIPLGGLR